MNLKGQLIIALMISFVSIICFGMLAVQISKHQILVFDSMVISSIQGMESSKLTAILKFFTFIGTTQVILVISFFVLIFLYTVLRHRSELILFSIVMVGTPIINLLLKKFFHRARPELHRLIEIGGYSFPSGHAMNAFSFYAIIAFLLWRHIPNRLGRTALIIFSCLFILLIGISRIYLGVHYPSDILAGYFASCLWLTIAVWIFQRYKDKQT